MGIGQVVLHQGGGFFPGFNVSIIPVGNIAIALETAEVVAQFCQEFFILTGIGDIDIDGVASHETGVMQRAKTLPEL